MLGWQMQLCGDQFAHQESVSEPLLSGAGIGVAGVRDNGLSRPSLDAGKANLHGRGANLIGREHARHRGRDFGQDERQIALPAFVGALAGSETFDVAEHTRGQETLGSYDRTRDGLEFKFHGTSRPRFSSYTVLTTRQ